MTIVARCRSCPGCRELDRRRLADRLEQRYPDRSTPLFLLRIYAPLASQNRAVRLLRRRKNTELEPGIYRLGVNAIAVLARSAAVLAALYKRTDPKARIERIRRTRGRRAWRPITAGLLVSRESYGAQRKRFYAAGLPPAHKERWTVEKLAVNTAYSRFTSPRAWSAGGLQLIPPAVFGLQRSLRRDLRRGVASATTPQEARRVLAMVFNGVRPLLHDAGVGRDTTQPTALHSTRLGNVLAGAVGARPVPPLTDSRSLAPKLWWARYASSGQLVGDGAAGDGDQAADRAPPGDPIVERLELDALKARDWNTLSNDERRRLQASLAQDVERQRVAAAERSTRGRAALEEALERLRQKMEGARKDGSDRKLRLRRL